MAPGANGPAPPRDRSLKTDLAVASGRSPARWFDPILIEAHHPAEASWIEIASTTSTIDRGWAACPPIAVGARRALNPLTSIAATTGGARHRAASLSRAYAAATAPSSWAAS